MGMMGHSNTWDSQKLSKSCPPTLLSCILIAIPPTQVIDALYEHVRDIKDAFSKVAPLPNLFHTATSCQSAKAN